MTSEMVLAWKANPVGVGRHGSPLRLKQPTAFQALWTLRGFLGHYRVPVAAKNALWRGKRGDATNRRWFDGRTLNRMYAAAPSDRHRLVLAALGWAGLRRNELWSLAVRDVNLSMDRPSMVLTRKGGRRQELPISKSVANAMRPFIVGRAPTDRVYPGSYSLIHSDVETLGRTVGVIAAPHDLRRTFGRLLYYEKSVDINDIRSLYGHATTEMSLYYIGAVSDRMRAAVERIDEARPQPVLPIPGAV